MKLFGKELAFGKVVDGSKHVYLDVNMNLEGLIAFILTAIFFFFMGMAV